MYERILFGVYVDTLHQSFNLLVSSDTFLSVMSSKLCWIKVLSLVVVWQYSCLQFLFPDGRNQWCNTFFLTRYFLAQLLFCSWRCWREAVLSRPPRGSPHPEQSQFPGEPVLLALNEVLSEGRFPGESQPHVTPQIWRAAAADAKSNLSLSVSFLLIREMDYSDPRDSRKRFNQAWGIR